MKFLISLAAIAALSIPVTAEAHARQKSCDCHCNDTRVTAPAVKPITTVTWTWVRARRVSGEYVPGPSIVRMRMRFGLLAIGKERVAGAIG